MDEVIPRDANQVHVGWCESGVLLDLSPGEHNFQILFGDEDHESQAAPLISERIWITHAGNASIVIWEQGRREPNGAVRSLICVAQERPEVLRDLFLDQVA